MSKTCKNCKKKFNHEPVTIPYFGRFCSYKCLYEYEDKDKVDRVCKFVWYTFNKKNGRIDKLLSGYYSVWDIYLIYLYFSQSKYPEDYSEKLIDEYDFPFLFMEIFELKKHFKLTIIAKTSKKNTQEWEVFLPYSTGKECYLPFGENLYFISDDNKTLQLYNEDMLDEEICNKLIDQKEKELEKLLVKTVLENGGICWKLAASSPGCKGAPDRVVVMSDSQVGFVEVKRPNGTGILSSIQIKRLNELLNKTNHVYVLDNPQNIISILQDIQFNTFPEMRYKKI